MACHDQAARVTNGPKRLGPRPWLGLTGLFLLIVLGTVLGIGLYFSLWLKLPLVHQGGHIQLSPAFKARVMAAKMLQMRFKGGLPVEVPLNQTITVPLKGNYAIEANLDGTLPLAFSIHLRHRIPIDTLANIQTSSRVILPHVPEFTIRAQLPIKLEVPVDMVIPVKTTARINYQGPAGLALNQLLKVPLQAKIKTRVPLDHPMDLPISSNFELVAYPPQRPLGIHFTLALEQPLHHIRLRPLEVTSVHKPIHP